MSEREDINNIANEALESAGMPKRSKPSADMDRRFDFHRPTGDKVAQHEACRASFKKFAAELDEHLPPGREKSLVMTKLEEALMWSNAAIARPPAPRRSS